MRRKVHLATAVLVMLSLLAATSAGGQPNCYSPRSDLSPLDRERLEARCQADAKESADKKAAREKMLRSAPLPAERNVLLGRWHVEGGGKARPRNDKDLFSAMRAFDGTTCEMIFGSRVTEFALTTLVKDGITVGSAAYRGGADKVIFVISTKNETPMGFDVADPNRIVYGGGMCTLVRVGAAATAAGPAPPARALATAAPRTPTTGVGAAVVDGAAFRCPNGALHFVSLCEGSSGEAVCKLSDPTVRLDLGTMMSRAAIAAKVQGCEAGAIRYGADDKPIFVR